MRKGLTRVRGSMSRISFGQRFLGCLAPVSTVPESKSTCMIANLFERVHLVFPSLLLPKRSRVPLPNCWPAATPDRLVDHVDFRTRHPGLNHRGAKDLVRKFAVLLSWSADFELLPSPIEIVVYDAARKSGSGTTNSGRDPWRRQEIERESGGQQYSPAGAAVEGTLDAVRRTNNILRINDGIRSPR